MHIKRLMKLLTKDIFAYTSMITAYGHSRGSCVNGAVVSILLP